MAITATRMEDGSFRFSGRSYSPTEDKNNALAKYGCMVRNWGVVLVLLPDESQKNSLMQQIGNARFVRNRYLEDRNKYYEDKKQILSPSEYKKSWLPKLKKEYEYLNLSDKFALEASIEHVDTAFKKFYNKEANFPKSASEYKPSGNQYTTKYTNGNITVAWQDGRPCLKLPKVGFVPFILQKGKNLEDIVPNWAKILSCSIKKSSVGFTASLQMETVITKPVFPTTVNVRDILAADVGLKTFATVVGEDGSEKIENPRWIRLHARRLRRFQQALARKKYDKKTHTGSKNREKARLRVAKEYRKCANQRKDFHHKLSRIIADSCTVFVCEDLNIKGMVKNRHLSKEISSVGWGSFLAMVKYKMENAGKYFLRVGRFYASSQICSKCGYKNPEVKDLSVREWVCPKCGAKHDRDVNAGMNMINEGIRILSGMGVSVEHTGDIAVA